jgi:hypothetical protein
MKSIGKTTRVNNALQVIQHMNAGMSLVDACAIVGMARSSFYSFVQTNPEVIAEVQAIIEANNREQLGLILANKNEILRKVIDAGLADETKPKDRLANFMKLSELADGLTKGLGIDNDIESQAHEFLKHGPQLVQAKSRFTATQTRVTIESDT